MGTKACVVVLLAIAAPARADEPVPAPVPVPTWTMSVGGLLRATARDADADQHLGSLEAYGYTTRAPALAGLRGELGYGNAPIVDVGVAWAWAKGTYAKGPLFDDPDVITGSTLELGAFARVHWVRRDAPVAAEPRVELGVARASIDLRGAERNRVGAYARVGLDVRAGGKKHGVMFSADYTAQLRGDDMDLDVPTGGITLSASVYFRQWQ